MGGVVKDSHAYPANDWVGHELDPSCVCGPDKEPVFHADRPRTWLYTHHALDGRRQAKWAA